MPEPAMHPFVALMRRYCIDYTNSHDQSVCDDLMEPDYVVHISGYALTRDESYRPAVADLFARAPGLGLVVHELVLNGERLCMRFSEHASMPTDDGRALACWKGIGLYRWNGTRLTSNWVEQDYLAMHRQLNSGIPHPLDPPHLDPWMSTSVVAPDEGAETAVRGWLAQGDLVVPADAEIDDSRVTGLVTGLAPLCVDPTEVTVNDLFSAGPRVAFHATVAGPYRGGLDQVPDSDIGQPASLHIAGVATVGTGGVIEALDAVTTRMAVRSQLTGLSPI